VTPRFVRRQEPIAQFVNGDPSVATSRHTASVPVVALAVELVDGFLPAIGVAEIPPCAVDLLVESARRRVIAQWETVVWGLPSVGFGLRAGGLVGRYDCGRLGYDIRSDL
jgi:hypothetical protein